LKIELSNQSKIVRADKLSSTGYNGVSLPSLGGKRRVHNDGLLMLDNTFDLREAE
jgi:hypothetical protein